MRLVEEVRPKKVDELIGNKDQISRLIMSIQVKRPVLIYGPPGIGKTSSVYAIANEYGYDVFEVNASDERKKEELARVLKIAKTKTLRKTIILFDEVDGMTRQNWRIIRTIIEESIHPVVLIANDEYKVPDWIKKRVEMIRFYRPSLREILEHIKRIAEKKGIKVKKFTEITKDVRNSILSAFYGAETYEQTTDFDVVKGFFQGKPNIDAVKKDEKLLIWLLDNAFYFYDNYRDAYRAIQLIALADKTKRYEILEMLPKGRAVAEPVYPYFFKKVSAWKRGEGNGGRI